MPCNMHMQCAYVCDVHAYTHGRYGFASKAAEKAAMPFMARLAHCMQPALFVPTEHPPPNRLYVIIKGDAVKLLGGATLKEGER